MDAHFHPRCMCAKKRYGDAVLTALPMRLVRAAPLPSIGEPRARSGSKSMPNARRCS